MQVTIREANKQDLPELARLISGDEAWQRYGIDIEEALRLLEKAEEILFVAETGGMVVGFCALKINGVDVD